MTYYVYCLLYYMGVDDIQGMLSTDDECVDNICLISFSQQIRA